MRQEERMGLILEELAGGGSVGVAEIAAKLGVSTASIRRDLQLLEQQRLLSRTHGGAVANATAYELPLRYRGGRRRDEKRRIAAAAAARIGDDVASVGLTGGTTTTEAAREGMNLDLAVVGVDGITVAGGLTTHHDIEAHTNRVLIGRARRVIVVADGSKVGRLAFSRICDVSSVHELITDASAAAPELQRLADAGIVITTV